MHYNTGQWTQEVRIAKKSVGLPRSQEYWFSISVNYALSYASQIEKTVVKEYSLHAIMDILLGILLRNVIYL